MGVLAGKVAIVAGITNSAGKSICAAFAQEGAKVVAVDWNEFAAAALVGNLEAAGREAIAVTCGRGDVDGVAAAVRSATDWFGTVDILVNNLESDTRGLALEDMADADFQRALADSVAMLQFTRACHPYLTGGGTVINVRSDTRMIAMVESATREWDWYAIKVKTLCTGPNREVDESRTVKATPGNPEAGDVGRAAVMLAMPQRAFDGHALAG